MTERTALREALGLLVALALAALALHHVLSTPSAQLLWYDGDSVLMPLMDRAFGQGHVLTWSMSPALFVFPELPLYLLCTAVTGTPQQALALFAVLVLLGVYGLLRGVAASVMPAASAFARVAVAAGGLGYVVLLVLTESSGVRNTLELATLLLTSTYYCGSVLTMLAVAALVLRIVRGEPVGAGRPAVVLLALVTALATASNPIVVAWSSAPTLLVLVLLAAARRLPVRTAVVAGAAIAVGVAVGLVARIPLGRFMSTSAAAYVHPGRSGETAGFLAALTDERAATAQGDAALFLLLLGAAAAIGGTVWAWRTRPSRTVLVAVALPAVTIVSTVVGVVLVGNDSTRYLQPVVTMPLVAFVGLAELARTAVRRTRLHRPATAARTVLAAVGALVLVLGVAVAPGTASAAAGARYDAGACLDRWAATRGGDATGVGQFWTVRPLAAYADTGAHLLQVRSDLGVYDWMVDLAAYRGANPTFVVIGSGDVWPTPVQDLLGDPASITHCTGYDLYDYAGTAGARRLRADVVGSAETVLEDRGL